MILIADSGSTKVSWRLLSPSGKILQAKTEGISPYYQDKESIIQTLESLYVSQLSAFLLSSKEVKEIYFYGTGCSTPERCKIVAEALRQVFSAAQIDVQTDILGAARGLCGQEQGIACILGTGSNATLYNGKNITQSSINLGFWLGDEGSGGYLGRQLITDFLNKEMPTHLHQLFEKRHYLTRDEVLDNVYKPFPNRYFASFSKFLFDHLREEYCYALVYKAFDLFFERHVCKFANYKNYKVHFTGSVAFYYANVLRQVANDKEITLKNITEEPSAGLVLYHQN
ncbi:MAG: N-acetylglucosamine kinase [Cytophagales bacterium]|nr:MAG: N-acetylglucosamine kinase [Cytophagales bacterium]